MMDPYIRKAKIVAISDGDTVTAVIDVGYRNTTTQKLRLARIDTPERGQPGWREATEYTKAALLGQDVIIRTEKSDDWDRWLAEIWYDADLDNISDRLLQQGLAKPYLKGK